MNSPSLEELIAQREQLDRRIDAMRTEQRDEVIRYCRDKVKAYGLTWQHLEDHGKRRRAQRSDKGIKRGRRAKH